LMELALSAGLVTRWLAKYPFPCALPENSGFNFKKADVARLCDRSAWLSDDPLIADIVLEVLQFSLGRKQMRDAGLNPSSSGERADRDTWDPEWGQGDWDEDNDVRMVGGDDTAGIARDDIPVWEDTLRPAVYRAESRGRAPATPTS